MSEYRIALRKANGYDVVTYRDDMKISDLFKIDPNILSVSIGTDRSQDNYMNLMKIISNLPAVDIDGMYYWQTSFEELRKMVENPSVIRASFVKLDKQYVYFSLTYSDSYGQDGHYKLVVSRN